MHCLFCRHQCPLKTETTIQERSTWKVLKNNLLNGQQKKFFKSFMGVAQLPVAQKFSSIIIVAHE